MSDLNSVPVINVEQVCQGIANQDVTFQDHGQGWVKKDCLDSEQGVRDKLTKVWESFPAADRKHCVTETRMGGESSYTELLTCLEMARDVRKIHEEAKIHEEPDAVRHPAIAGQR
jgi:hypothetical protein